MLKLAELVYWQRFFTGIRSRTLEERQELEDAIRSQSQSSPKADAEVVDLEVETDAAAVTKKDTVAKASKASKASKAASKASKAEE